MSGSAPRPFRGRGATGNPDNPFERFRFEPDPGLQDALAADPDDGPAALRTQILRDDTQSLITRNTSPDLSFEASINPYRGCEHGCSYCYARRYHEFLGFSSGLDFETKLLAKADAPAILRRELSSPRWRPVKLAMSGVTDPWQPVERKLRITRGCLEVLAEFRQPVVVITKNHLITRDIDLLGELARWQAGAALISITSLDSELAGILEPRAARPAGRLDAVSRLAAAGIPCGVSVAPVIPGLNDHEIPAILKAAREAGASFATWSPVRLPGSVADVFDGWLRSHFPEEVRAKVLGRIRELHGGRVNETRPGVRFRGSGELAGQLNQLFTATARRLGFSGTRPPVTAAGFRRVDPGQPELF